MQAHNHFRLLHFSLKKDLDDIYLTLFLRTFALTLIGIFIPLYLLKELHFAFADVLMYLMMVYIFLLCGYLIGFVLIRFIRTETLILISIPIQIAYYFLLYNFDTRNISLAVLGVLLGLSEGIFWLAYNVDFTKFSDKTHRVDEVKIWYVLASAIGVIGPLLGGFLLTRFDFHVVFILVIILLCLSFVPLIALEKRSPVYPRVIHFKYVFHKGHVKNAQRYYVQGVRHLITGVFWPLTIFVFVKEYFSLGLVTSGAAFVSFFVIWWTSGQLTKVNRVVLTDFSALIHGLVSFIKVSVTTFEQVFLVAIASYTTYGVSEIAAESLSFDQASKSRPVEFFVFREVMLTLGRVSMLAVIFFVGLDLLASLKLGFILLGAISILQRFF